MNFVLEQVFSVFLFLYYILEAIVLLFVPSKLRFKDVKGQVVLVTGAGSGIGRLTAVRFAKLGCRLVLWDINSSGNEETAQLCRQAGAASATSYTCDLSRHNDVYVTADKVKSEIGNVDILINNAGVVTGKKLLDCPDSMIEKTMQVNVMAHFWTTRAFLPAMLSNNRGHVVTVASVAGFFGNSNMIDYCSSKFAAVGFDESLRAELYSRRRTGVKTTVVCPYHIDTGMFEGAQMRMSSLFKILTPEYVADQIVEAVLTNKPLVCIPRIFYVFVALKHFIPVKAQLMMNDVMGSSTFMDGFRGRTKHN